MYQDFFSLNKAPFLIAPAPDFIFFTEQHKEALAHLTYGLQGNGGFVVLTGEVGTGKTTICQFLLQDMPADTDVASITNSSVSRIALLVDICNQFSIDYDQDNISLKVMFDALASWMLNNHQQGRHAIVLIDEAQHLSFDVLEQLRLLTNIEADNQKPLQIILVGQTSLQENLLTKELRQLSQRITARYHLRTLNQQETNFYIHHRLNLAGAKGAIFDPKSIPAIYKASQGVPLLINQICDRCLLSAYTHSWLTVTPKLAKKVIQEAELPTQKNAFKGFISPFVVIISVILVTFFFTQQIPNVKQYFESSPEELKQQEWSRIINTANNQKSNNPTQETTSVSPALEPVAVPTYNISPLENLLAMPVNDYTLELATFEDEQAVKDFFMAHASLQENTLVYHLENANKEKFVILQGPFESYKMAKTASKALEEHFPDIDPWIKDYKMIHSDIKWSF
tara:strand:+ start:1260 stop:2621 length:1362 start_codon:yes stop_codon:yes gene_type:complete